MRENRRTVDYRACGTKRRAWERLTPALAQRADLGAADLLDRVAQMLSDVEAVQDVERVPGFLGDDLQIRLPHVAARRR